jgi:uncharacterized RDD family membrane protein YckC
VLLDTVYRFETPEGVDLGLRVAGPVSRALAWVIDALIRYAVLFALTTVSASLLGLGFGLFMIMLFLMEWLYPVVFEVTRGATPGKKAMGLLVVHDNGTPIGWSASMIRNLLRSVDFLPLLYGFGLVSILLNSRFKRLGDLAAGTLVVYAEKPSEPSELVQAQAQAQAQALPVALSVDEQRALIDFAERRSTIAPERVQELAEFITEERGPQAVETVLSYASWIARGR